MSRLAVLGSPICHSKSPAIHRAAYAALELDWQYERFELQAPELRPFLESTEDAWLGFSCTMPLKEAAHEIATELDPVAKRTGVVNTLLRDGHEWFGANTDVGGLRMALQDCQLDLSSVIVLGAGATAISAVMAAQEAGAGRIEVRARRVEAAHEIATEFGTHYGALAETPQHDPTTVISTLPGEAGKRLQLTDAYTRADLFDVAYDPWPSPLTKVWVKSGGRAYSGIDMLIYQAVLQIRLFVSRDLTLPLVNEDTVIAAMRQAASTSMGE